jgi:hypothetical protein
MRRLLPCLLLAAALAGGALPATAGAKGRHGLPDGGEPTRVAWLTAPDGQRPGGPGWLARVRITGAVAPRPQIVVRDEVSGDVERRAASPDGAGTWAARVRFPRAGRYTVWVADYDPQDPWRIHDIGPAVRIEAPRAPAASGAGGSFPFWPVVPLGLLAAAGLAVGTRMVRPRLDHGLS